MGIYIEPRSEEAKIVVSDCIISEVVGEGIRIADGVSYEIHDNSFDGVGIVFASLDDEEVPAELEQGWADVEAGRVVTINEFNDPKIDWDSPRSEEE